MQNESSVKERLKEFVSYLNISEREFCRTIGVGSAYIASIKKSIKADKLEAITKQYPQLNPVWLIRGEGEMLIPVRSEEDSTPKSTELAPTEMLYKLLEDAKEEKARLLSIIESQQRTIETLAELTKKANARTEGNAGCAAAV
jgi:hypothetical protein